MSINFLGVIYLQLLLDLALLIVASFNDVKCMMLRITVHDAVMLRSPCGEIFNQFLESNISRKLLSRKLKDCPGDLSSYTVWLIVHLRIATSGLCWRVLVLSGLLHLKIIV